jgi:MYXO-CTERM domain-containing protein
MSLTAHLARLGLAATLGLLLAPREASGQVEPFAALHGSVHPLVREAVDAGRLDGDTRFEAVSLVFRPSPARQAALEALLASQRDPASPDFHAWLTPERFGERFGATPADLARATAWLRSQGLAVAGPSRSRTRLAFSGTARQLEAAFHTELHRYVHRGEPHLANATELSVPAALAPVLAGVRNLDDFRPAPRAVGRAVPADPAFTSSVSGNHYVAPGDFAVIYGVAGAWAAGLDGTGETIAVVGQSALDPADVAAFRAAAGLPANPPTLLLVPGSGTSTVVSGDVTEATLDVEWSGAVARGARILFVYTGNDARFNVWDALQYAIDHSLAPVVSTSYGFCEPLLGSANALQLRQLAQQANAQGQTIAAAAGDSGAADCEARGATVATHGLAVDLPASIPEVTGVGGTALAADVASPSTYWSATSAADGTSALGYIPERAWNDTAAGGVISAGGGGASTFFAKPAWQAGAGVPADGQRDVPDVSLDASPAHDGYLFCVQGSCVNGFRSSSKGLSVVGGTSVGAPTFAGILAIVDQATGGHRLGNANPQLYALWSSSPAAFHLVTAGDNRVPCTAGTPDCPAAAPFVIGYAAGPGYSPAAGLGSVDARALVTAWRGGQRAASATAIAASATSAPAAAPLTFTATVTPAAGGATPTGTVLFLADGQPIGGAVALAAGRASASTSTLAAGAHAVTASYSGDAAYLPSTSPPVAVTVQPGLDIAGATTTPPRGTLLFTATGGSGAGYTWTFLTNASGGTLDGGRYTAGPTGDVIDAIRVVDSLGTAGAVDVVVTAGVTITPPGASVAPGGALGLVARGGSGAGFAWSLAANGSGATIGAATGAYVAGPTGGVQDVVRVVDSLGNSATGIVVVTAPASAGSAGGVATSRGGCASAGAGGGLPALLALGALGLLRRWRRRSSS